MHPTPVENYTPAVSSPLSPHRRRRAIRGSSDGEDGAEGSEAILGSPHNPKFLCVDGAEIVRDRMTEVYPVPGNFFTRHPADEGRHVEGVVAGKLWGIARSSLASEQNAKVVQNVAAGIWLIWFAMGAGRRYDAGPIPFARSRYFLACWPPQNRPFGDARLPGRGRQ
jgi:hypothetical protein